MAQTLKVDLQDGFADDTVFVCVNGKEMYRKSDVTTRTQLGLADSVELDVDGDRAELLVGVPARHLNGGMLVDLTRTRNVGVGLEAGQLRFRLPSEPDGYFGYV